MASVPAMSMSIVAGTNATVSVPASARAPSAEPCPPMTSRADSSSAAAASRQADRPASVASAGQRLVPSHVPGSCAWARATAAVIASARASASPAKPPRTPMAVPPSASAR